MTTPSFSTNNFLKKALCAIFCLFSGMAYAMETTPTPIQIVWNQQIALKQLVKNWQNGPDNDHFNSHALYALETYLRTHDIQTRMSNPNLATKYKQREGSTLLLHAAQFNCVTTTQWLIASGATNQSNGIITPIDLAYQCKSVGVIEILKSAFPGQKPKDYIMPSMFIADPTDENKPRLVEYKN